MKTDMGAQEAQGRIIIQINIRGKIRPTDLVAFYCDLFMLVLLIWTQIKYGLQLLFLILPLLSIGIYLALFCLIPESYAFEIDALMIRHPFRKQKAISYTAVFNYEYAVSERFSRIKGNAQGKVYYTANGKNKMAVCLPEDGNRFSEAIYCNCPVFQEENGEKSRLETFLREI